jgi:hypothetical protein
MSWLDDELERIRFEKVQRDLLIRHATTPPDTLPFVNVGPDGPCRFAGYTESHPSEPQKSSATFWIFLFSLMSLACSGCCFLVYFLQKGG